MSADIDATARILSIRLKPETADAIDREAGRIGITSAEWAARIVAGVLQLTGKVETPERKRT